MDNKKYEMYQFQTEHEGFQVEIGMTHGPLAVEDVAEFANYLVSLHIKIEEIYCLLVKKRSGGVESKSGDQNRRHLAN